VITGARTGKSCARGNGIPRLATRAPPLTPVASTSKTRRNLCVFDFVRILMRALNSIPPPIMKTPLRVQFSRSFAIALTLIISALGAAGLKAQTVYLTFSGGNGSEVAITWTTPITYTLTSSTGISGVNPVFVFQAIPNSQAIFQTSGAVGGGAPTYARACPKNRFFENDPKNQKPGLPGWAV